MQVFVRDHHAMIAAPVQRDVDGIPEGSHDARVAPIEWVGKVADPSTPAARKILDCPGDTLDCDRIASRRAFVALARPQSQRDESHAGKADATKVIVGIVVEGRRTSRIRLVTRWNIHHHSLSRARQQDAIRVHEISLSVFLVDRRPGITSKGMETPRLCVAAQVGVPCHAHPIELEALNLEFGGGILQECGSESRKRWTGAE
jgi:hypothetical protein